MVSRSSIPSLPRPTISVDTGRVAQAAKDLADWRPPRGDERRLILIRALWAPFWLASDIPKPGFRRRDVTLPPGGLVGDYFVAELSRLTLRIWLQHILTIIVRTAWLPLLVGCCWLAIELAGGPRLRPWALIALSAALIPFAAVFASWIKPSRRQVARMLDRSFALQERMVTAFDGVGRDVPQPGASPSVTYLQMADAANVISELRNHSAFRICPPVREIVLTIVFALLLSALFFLRGVGGGIPALASDPIPAFVPAAERLAQQPEPEPQTGSAQADAPTTAEVQERAERSSQVQQDLKKLADALSDQAVTRAAAEAIQRGDYAEAADLIRQVAENADELSPAAREGLANDLERAANEMSPGDNPLAAASNEAASGLREGGEAAQQGMQELGETVDRTASDIVSQQELATEMAQAEAAEGSESGSQSGEPGEPGESSPSESSQSGAAEPQDESGAGGQPSSAEAPPGEEAGSESEGPGEDGSAGGEQPGGTNAEPGGQEGSSQAGAEGQSQAPDGAAPGQGQQSGQPSDGTTDPGSEGPESEGGDPGAGAGSGGTNEENPSGGGQATSEGEPGEGDPSSPDVTEGDGPAGEGTGESQDPRSAITLSRSPGEAGVQTGGQGNSASAGSGSGASVSTGSSVQGEVGVAGPDSNHVPTEYRGLVEDYFSDQDGS